MVAELKWFIVTHIRAVNACVLLSVCDLWSAQLLHCMCLELLFLQHCIGYVCLYLSLSLSFSLSLRSPFLSSLQFEHNYSTS